MGLLTVHLTAPQLYEASALGGWILAFIVFGRIFCQRTDFSVPATKGGHHLWNCSLKNLRKEFGGNAAVSGITAVLEPGIYGLLGANGAGKTNTFADDLRSLATYCRSGMSGWDFPLTHWGAAYRDKLGYLPQDFAGYPQYSARDFLLYMGPC